MELIPLFFVFNIYIMVIIFVKDEKIGGYTSYNSQRPNIISEGATIEEARKNLIELTKNVMAYEGTNDFLTEELEKISINKKLYNWHYKSTFYIEIKQS